jgi:hypothetical protein
MELLVTIATFIDSSRQALENDQLSLSGLVLGVHILEHCAEQPATIRNLIDSEIATGSLAASFELAFLLPLVSSATETKVVAAAAKRVWEAAISHSDVGRRDRLLSTVLSRLRDILSDPESRIL